MSVVLLGGINKGSVTIITEVTEFREKYQGDILSLAGTDTVIRNEMYAKIGVKRLKVKGTIGFIHDGSV